MSGTNELSLGELIFSWEWRAHCSFLMAPESEQETHWQTSMPGEPRIDAVILQVGLYDDTEWAPASFLLALEAILHRPSHRLYCMKPSGQGKSTVPGRGCLL